MIKIPGVIGSIIDGVNDVTEAISDTADYVVDGVVSSGEYVVDTVEDTAQAVGGAITGVGDKAVDRIQQYDALDAAIVFSLYPTKWVGTKLVSLVAEEAVDRFATPGMKKAKDDFIQGGQKVAKGTLDFAQESAKGAKAVGGKAFNAARRGVQLGADKTTQVIKIGGPKIYSTIESVVDKIPRGTDPLVRVVDDIAADAKKLKDGGEVLVRRGKQVVSPVTKAVKGVKDVSVKSWGKGMTGKIPVVGSIIELAEGDVTGAAAELGDAGLVATGYGAPVVAATMVGTTAYGLATGKHDYILTGPIGALEVRATGD